MTQPTAPIAVGEVVHIITRRKFESEAGRHFVGRIVVADGLHVRVQGYAFVCDVTRQEVYVKQKELRTRVLNLADSGLIVNVLPAEAAIEHVHYERTNDGRLVVTDGTSFSLGLQEFGPSR